MLEEIAAATASAAAAAPITPVETPAVAAPDAALPLVEALAFDEELPESLGCCENAQGVNIKHKERIKAEDFFNM